MTLRPEMDGAGRARVARAQPARRRARSGSTTSGRSSATSARKRGRFREAHQFGVECFGFAGPEADVEVMQLAHELLRAYGVAGATRDQLDRRRGLPAALPRARCSSTCARASDELSADSQRRLERNPLRILDSKAPEDRAAVAVGAARSSITCAARARSTSRAYASLLDAVGLAYRVDPRIVRGLDYYTRTVFEFVSTALGAQSAVCGGGRYDDLVKQLGGPPTPAVGFGLGLERFLMVVEASGAEAPAPRAGIAVIALGSAARAHAIPLVAALRRDRRRADHDRLSRTRRSARTSSAPTAPAPARR